MYYLNPKLSIYFYLIVVSWRFFTLVYMNENFGVANLCLPFKASPMIKLILLSDYFTEGLALCGLDLCYSWSQPTESPQ